MPWSRNHSIVAAAGGRVVAVIAPPSPPDAAFPDVGEPGRPPDRARTFERLVEAEDNARHNGRSAGLRAARDRFYKGDIAREIVAFQRDTKVRDANGME